MGLTNLHWLKAHHKYIKYDKLHINMQNNYIENYS